MGRRRLLRLLGLATVAGLAPAWAGRVLAVAPVFPAVRPRPLVFPRDHGAHPDFRTEWWYATGWLETPAGAAGFQITFFRSRSEHDAANPSRFAPHQLLFAHAALAWPGESRLRHEQRAARVVAGDPGASYGETDTDLTLAGWRFLRDAGDGGYRAEAAGDELDLQLVLRPTLPLLLQGEAGYSRKGPGPDQASYYYSRPQLAVTGRAGPAGRPLPVTGRAWLDHEWSTSVLDAAAVGWDWLGVNLEDGGALMAFRIRGRDGPDRWAAACLRRADGSERRYGPGEVSFEATGRWRSPHSGATYPVRGRLHLGRSASRLSFDYGPLLDDQEIDARASTGGIYWEGAVRLTAGRRLAGRGYLELVGYHRAMRL